MQAGRGKMKINAHRPSKNHHETQSPHSTQGPFSRFVRFFHDKIARTLLSQIFYPQEDASRTRSDTAVPDAANRNKIHRSSLYFQETQSAMNICIYNFRHWYITSSAQEKTSELLSLERCHCFLEFIYTHFYRRMESALRNATGNCYRLKAARADDGHGKSD